MKNSGSENSIPMTDGIFESDHERLYFELFERITNRALEMAEQLWFIHLGDPAFEAVAELLQLLGDIEASPDVG